MASYLLGPIKRYLSDILTARLAEYVDGVELGDLGVLGSDLVVKHVNLRLEKIQSLIPPKAPIKILRGSADELRISIPWTALLSSPIQIRLTNVQIGFALEADDKPDTGTVDTPTSASFDSSVEAASLPTPTKSVLPEWINSRLAKILANIALCIDGLTLRIDAHNGAYLLFSAGIIDVSSADPADQWAAGFAEPFGSRNFIGKSVSLLDIMLECDMSREKDKDSVSEASTRTECVEDPLLAKTNLHIRSILPINFFDPATSQRQPHCEHPRLAATAVEAAPQLYDPFATSVHRMISQYCKPADDTQATTVASGEDGACTAIIHVLIDYVDFVVSPRQLSVLMSLLDRWKYHSQLPSKAKHFEDATTEDDTRCTCTGLSASVCFGGFSLTLMKYALRRPRVASEVTSASADNADPLTLLDEPVLRVPVHQHGVVLVSSAEKRSHRAERMLPTPFLRLEVGSGCCYSQVYRDCGSKAHKNLTTVKLQLGAITLLRWSLSDETHMNESTADLRRQLANMVYAISPSPTDCKQQTKHTGTDTLCCITGIDTLQFGEYDLASLFAEQINDFLRMSRFARMFSNPEYRSYSVFLALEIHEVTTSQCTTLLDCSVSRLRLDVTSDDAIEVYNWFNQPSQRIRSVTHTEVELLTKPRASQVKESASQTITSIKVNNMEIDVTVGALCMSTTACSIGLSSRSNSGKHMTSGRTGVKHASAMDAFAALKLASAVAAYENELPRGFSKHDLAIITVANCGNRIIEESREVSVGVSGVRCWHSPESVSGVSFNSLQLNTKSISNSMEQHNTHSCTVNGASLVFTKLARKLSDLRLCVESVHVQSPGEISPLAWPATADVNTAVEVHMHRKVTSHGEDPAVFVRVSSADVQVDRLVSFLTLLTQIVKSTKTQIQNSIPKQEDARDVRCKADETSVQMLDQPKEGAHNLLDQLSALHIDVDVQPWRWTFWRRDTSHFSCSFPLITCKSTVASGQTVADLLIDVRGCVVGQEDVAAESVVTLQSRLTIRDDKIHADITLEKATIALSDTMAVAVGALQRQLHDLVQLITPPQTPGHIPAEHSQELRVSNDVSHSFPSLTTSVSCPRATFMYLGATNAMSTLLLHVDEIDVTLDAQAGSVLVGRVIWLSAEEQRNALLTCKSGEGHDDFVVLGWKRKSSLECDGYDAKCAIGLLSFDVTVTDITTLIHAKTVWDLHCKTASRADQTIVQVSVAMPARSLPDVQFALRWSGLQFRLGFETHDSSIVAKIDPLIVTGRSSGGAIASTAVLDGLETVVQSSVHGIGASITVAKVELTFDAQPSNSVAISVGDVVVNADCDMLAPILSDAITSCRDLLTAGGHGSSTSQHVNITSDVSTRGSLDCKTRLGSINVAVTVGTVPCRVLLRHIETMYITAIDTAVYGRATVQSFAISISDDAVWTFSEDLQPCVSILCDQAQRAGDATSFRVAALPIAVCISPKLLSWVVQLTRLPWPRNQKPSTAGDVDMPFVTKAHSSAQRYGIVAECASVALHLKGEGDELQLIVENIRAESSAPDGQGKRYRGIEHTEKTVPLAVADASSVQISGHVRLQLMAGDQCRVVFPQTCISGDISNEYFSSPPASVKRVSIHVPETQATLFPSLVAFFQRFAQPLLQTPPTTQERTGSQSMLRAPSRPIPKQPLKDHQVTLQLGRAKSKAALSFAHSHKCVVVDHGADAEYMSWAEGGWWVCTHVALPIGMFLDSIAVTGPLYLTSNSFLRIVQADDAMVTTAAYPGIVSKLNCAVDIKNELGSWVNACNFSMDCAPVEQIYNATPHQLTQTHHSATDYPCSDIRIRWQEPILSHSSKGWIGGIEVGEGNQQLRVQHAPYSAISMAMTGAIAAVLQSTNGDQVAHASMVVSTKLDGLRVVVDAVSNPLPQIHVKQPQHPRVSGIITNSSVHPLVEIGVGGELTVSVSPCKRKVIHCRTDNVNALLIDPTSLQAWKLLSINSAELLHLSSKGTNATKTVVTVDRLHSQICKQAILLALRSHSLLMNNYAASTERTMHSIHVINTLNTAIHCRTRGVHTRTETSLIQAGGAHLLEQVKFNAYERDLLDIALHEDVGECLWNTLDLVDPASFGEQLERISWYDIRAANSSSPLTLAAYWAASYDCMTLPFKELLQISAPQLQHTSILVLLGSHTFLLLGENGLLEKPYVQLEAPIATSESMKKLQCHDVHAAGVSCCQQVVINSSVTSLLLPNVCTPRTEVAETFAHSMSVCADNKRISVPLQPLADMGWELRNGWWQTPQRQFDCAEFSVDIMDVFPVNRQESSLFSTAGFRVMRMFRHPAVVDTSLNTLKAALDKAGQGRWPSKFRAMKPIMADSLAVAWVHAAAELKLWSGNVLIIENATNFRLSFPAKDGLLAVCEPQSIVSCALPHSLLSVTEGIVSFKAAVQYPNGYRSDMTLPLTTDAVHRDTIVDEINEQYGWPVTFRWKVDECGGVGWRLSVVHSIVVLRPNPNTALSMDDAPLELLTEGNEVYLPIRVDTLFIKEGSRLCLCVKDVSDGSQTSVTLHVGKHSAKNRSISIDSTLTQRYTGLQKLYGAAYIPAETQVRILLVLNGRISKTMVVGSSFKHEQTVISIEHDDVAPLLLKNISDSPVEVRLKRTRAFSDELEAYFQQHFRPSPTSALFGFITELEKAIRHSDGINVEDVDAAVMLCAVKKSEMAAEVMDLHAATPTLDLPEADTPHLHPLLRCTINEQTSSVLQIGPNHSVAFDWAFLTEFGYGNTLDFGKAFVPRYPLLWDAWTTQQEKEKGIDVLLAPLWLHGHKVLDESSVAVFHPEIEFRCVEEEEAVWQSARAAEHKGEIVYTLGEAVQLKDLGSAFEIRVQSGIFAFLDRHMPFRERDSGIALVLPSKQPWWTAEALPPASSTPFYPTSCVLFTVNNASASHNDDGSTASSTLSLGAFRLIMCHGGIPDTILQCSSPTTTADVALTVESARAHHGLSGLARLSFLRLHATIPITVKVTDDTIATLRDIVHWCVQMLPHAKVRVSKPKPVLTQEVFIGSAEMSSVDVILTTDVNNLGIPIHVGLRESKIRLTSQNAAYILAPPARIVQEWMAALAADVILNVPFLLGSLDVMGNVGGVVTGVTRALQQIAWSADPRGGSRGPVAAILRLLEGTGNLVAHTGRAVASSFGSLAAGIARTAQAIDQELHHAEPPTSRLLIVTENPEVRSALPVVHWTALPWQPVHHLAAASTVHTPTVPPVTLTNSSTLRSGVSAFGRGISNAASKVLFLPFAIASGESVSDIASGLASAVLSPLIGSATLLAASADGLANLLDVDPDNAGKDLLAIAALVTKEGVWRVHVPMWTAALVGNGSVAVAAVLLRELPPSATASIASGVAAWLLISPTHVGISVWQPTQLIAQFPTSEVRLSKVESECIPDVEQAILIRVEKPTPLSAAATPTHDHNPFRHSPPTAASTDAAPRELFLLVDKRCWDLLARALHAGV